MKKKLIAAISVGVCAAVTAGILVFNSAGGENQVGSGWYLKNGEAFSEAIYVNENARNTPSQVFGENYILYEGRFINTENGDDYVYVVLYVLYGPLILLTYILGLLLWAGWSIIKCVLRCIAECCRPPEKNMY